MIGRRINDRYKIISRVGDGGMSVVYKAEDLILDRLVAVKVLRSDFSSDEAFIRRFRREAESVASLSDPNIVSIYDIGEEENLHYIVMEFIDGMTLKEYIKQFGPLPSRDAVYILKQIASALEHAHNQGIIHRDIKPQNILIDDQDNVKVTDFGIALAISSATITFTTSIMGSAHYLSPEQAKGGKATAKSDVYAFGIVMYEMLTGELPFPGESPVTVALKHLNDDYTRPKVLNPNIPQSLENIIIRAMAKLPEERFDGMSEIYQELTTALNPDRIDEPPLVLNGGEDPEATKVIPPIASFEDKGPTEQVKKAQPEATSTPVPKKKRKRKKIVIWSSIIVGIVILAVLAIILLPKLLFVPDVTVPNVVGKTYDQAVDTLTDKHLYVKKKMVENDQKPSGIVVDESPNSGSSVKENSTVTLVVSKGPAKEEVADYVGYDRSTVKQLLKGSQYKDIVWKGVPSDSVPADQVMTQKPDPNTKIVPSETVLELTYSTGPEKVSVPDVTGQSKDSATQTLENEGLQVIVQDGDYSDSIAKGDVLSTDPAAGQKVTKDTEVTVYLSKGQEEQPVNTSVQIPVDPSSSDNSDDGTDTDTDTNGDTPTEHHVVITYTDAKNQNAVFKDETISKATTYTLPLTIDPGSSATYTVVLDGTTVQQKTIQYSDVKKG
ncbi:Stk1 family PASTA domain-containing Ser/Thr kinase [Pullulanibacillus sp. KACC 23026]|uniref:Stk1 family PASTA domain-containing Ser/Thr kinase n=1 Tax=Pullulanibacillus sp. KACC 23026 TaxID=3028315 RepID=UPI0023AF7EA2|nr:Stk1 family PASTA domain-containing Ser/Thr kinase [Pullulanibacillus sp. KACC 23026]WEG11627.1 Stk1 family PASTA domain-containing Ser/Thr kinase [Pullulanibacillus sp. KACC 23026]